jgi:hypothetical protein
MRGVTADDLDRLAALAATTPFDAPPAAERMEWISRIRMALGR